MTLYEKSIQIIRAGQAATGAYVASPTFSQYGYGWLRDGAWTAYGMDCVGQHDSARAFYQWAARTLLGQRERLDKLFDKLARGESPQETDYLPTRFTVDGQIDSNTFWWDFQLDGYGAWVWGLAQHIHMTDNAIWESVRPAVELTVRYLAALWQSPNYDCWEEHRQEIHLSTLAAIYGGLKAIESLEPVLVPPGLTDSIRQFVLEQGISGHFMKFLKNTEVDASLMWLAVPYKLVDVSDPVFLKTLAKIEQDLHVPGGGVYRYKADVYYGGGEWILLTAWLGWVLVEIGVVEEARRLLHWIEAQANAQGELPEQVSGHLLAPGHYAEWEARWGTSACPLLWSHAMYLILKTQLDKHS